MRNKLRLLLLIFLLISLSYYYIINQSHKDENIDQTTKKKEEVIENIEKPDENDVSDEIEEEELKTKITDIVKNTFEFLFTQEFHVVAIGDSLTQGVGDSTKNGGYIGILDEIINKKKQIVTFDNFGKSGRSSDLLLKALDDPEMITAIEGTDIVLMTIGANDIMKVVQQNYTKFTYSLLTEEQIHFEQRLNDIFIRLRAINPNAHIYLLGVFNPFKQYFQDIEELDLIVEHWNQTSERTAAQYAPATFIPIKDLFDEKVINLFAEDHFHPNELGYERMARRVLEYLADGEGSINEQAN